MTTFEPSKGLQLVLLMGLQGSGKSSLVRRHFATHVHVSKDLMSPSARNKGERQRKLIDEALAAGKSVVVDNTHPRRVDRSEVIAQARANGAEVVGVFVDAKVAECLVRNSKREGRARVPIIAIMATKKFFEPPTLGEGYDALYVAELRPGSDAFQIRRVIS